MMARDYDYYRQRFREDYEEFYEDTDYPYEQYDRAYRFGYDLATRDRDYEDWSVYEEEAQREWEQQDQGPWEDFKDAIRHAWEEVTGQET